MADPSKKQPEFHLVSVTFKDQIPFGGVGISCAVLGQNNATGRNMDRIAPAIIGPDGMPRIVDNAQLAQGVLVHGVVRLANGMNKRMAFVPWENVVSMDYAESK